MAENREINSNLRDAFSNLAQEARNLLDNYDDVSSSAIERQLLHSTPTARLFGKAPEGQSLSSFVSLSYCKSTSLNQ